MLHYRTINKIILFYSDGDDTSAHRVVTVIRTFVSSIADTWRYLKTVLFTVLPHRTIYDFLLFNGDIIRLYTVHADSNNLERPACNYQLEAPEKKYCLT